MQNQIEGETRRRFEVKFLHKGSGKESIEEREALGESNGDTWRKGREDRRQEGGEKM